MRRWLMVFMLTGVWACGGDQGSPRDTHTPTGTPSTAEPDATDTAEAESPAPEHDEVLTPDECEARGGIFRPSPGGAVSCEEGEEEIGRVRFGIEGGVCCR